MKEAMKKQVRQEEAPIRTNALLQGEYYRLAIRAPAIAPLIEPGQFVHVLLPGMGQHLLRRPFSVCDVDPATGELVIIYKVVGHGTRLLAGLEAGAVLDLLGPLGTGYSRPPPERRPIIVAGGYGCAATYLFARRSPRPPLVLLGGRGAGDILLVEEFRALGCEVRLATDDGSTGHRGFVTDLLEEALRPAADPFVIACGPNAMLRTVSRIVGARGFEAEVSLDHVMCCGVGACFACVVKVKAETPDGWEYARTCISGPVFPASRIVWESDEVKSETEKR